MSKFSTEKMISAGGVVYRRVAQQAQTSQTANIEIALINAGRQRRWQLPKGQVETGETHAQTAVREIKEETGITADVVRLLETVEYWFFGKRGGERVRYHKFVHFFLLDYQTGDIGKQNWEVHDAQWFPIDEAEEMLSYKNEKAVIAKARAEIAQLSKQPPIKIPANIATTEIISWNINGIRAVVKKGFVAWLAQAQPDILCIQETKCLADQIPAEITALSDYHQFYAFAERKGYAGVAIFSKQEPLAVHVGMGIAEFDAEGRTIAAEFPDYIIVNGYFPNGGADLARVAYKMRYKQAFLAYCNQWREQGKRVIFCGDLNTAHRAIDVARPRTKKNKSGFLEEERNWIDGIIDFGYEDTFRRFHAEREGAFTCWPYSRNSRERNIGWRLDYIFVDPAVAELVLNADIDTTTLGSDHCPISLTLGRRH